LQENNRPSIAAVMASNDSKLQGNPFFNHSSRHNTSCCQKNIQRGNVSSLADKSSVVSVAQCIANPQISLQAGQQHRTRTSTPQQDIFPTNSRTCNLHKTPADAHIQLSPATRRL
jgi:hypothetical protein